MNIIGKTLLIILVSFFTYQLLSSPTPFIFIDNLNLLIHEAGHLIFFFFGQFIDVLAGSVFQILIPCLFFFYFFKRKEYFSLSFVLFWIADNIINVSVYMKDAVPMSLPLLGGDNVFHDWNYLFTVMHLLPISFFIGQGFYILGILLLLTSIIGMIFFTIKDSKAPRI